MRRQLTIALVAGFVVVDVLLVVLAVRHVNETAPPGSSGVPTSPTALPEQPTPSPAANTPPVSPASSTSPPASPDTQPRPNVLLSVGFDGTMLRSTAGDCRGTEPAVVEVSTDGGSSFEPVLDDVAQVLRVVAVYRGDLWIVATDQACHPGIERSGDTGASWVRSSGTEGAWHLATSVDSRRLHAPSGFVSVGCVGITLAPLDDDVAYVGCDDGGIRASRDAGQTWSNVGHVDGLVSLAFRDETIGYALAHHDRCAATVLKTRNGGATWNRTECLEGKEPEAIAANGAWVVAQAGDGLFVSSDGDKTWARTR